MNQNLFIIDENYKDIILDKDSIKDIIKNKTDIIVGNYLYKIFNFKLNNKEDYELYSYNIESKLNPNENIYKLLKLTDNHIGYYDSKYYMTKELKDTLDVIIKNTDFSDEYKVFLLNKMQKQEYSIYDYIDLCDLDNCIKVANNQYELIKVINNITYIPITYCLKKILTEKSTTIKHLLKNIYDLLCNFEYEIHPKLYDINNIDYFDSINLKYKYQYNDLFELLNIIINENKKLFIRCVNIFNLDYTNHDFIYLLKSHNIELITEILELLLKNKIYSEEKYLEMLLLLDRVNLFVKQNKKVDFNKIIKYLIKYNSFVSFYYLIEKYNDEIKIDVLPIDFLKIYITINKNNNKIINSLIKSNQKHINYLLDNYNKSNICNEDKKFLSDFLIDVIDINILKKVIKLDENIKYNLINNNYILKILEKKEEEMFYYFINLFDRKEQEKIFLETKDNEGNTIYHYICKNNICLGMNINNKIRNNKGYKPLDLCQIIHKYYKL